MGGNLWMREDAENRERKKQPVDANGRDTFPRGSFALRRKESDHPKNESTGDDQQGTGSQQKQPNRTSAQSMAAEQIHCNAEAGCEKTEQCCLR